MILFLDFDGVLHPQPLPPASVGFDGLDRLRAIVQARPWVDVVIHSSWRQVQHMDDSDFADILNLGPQFLGCTPREVPSRWESIQAWLRQHPESMFVIVDDQRSSFPTEAHPHLISPVGLLGMLEGDWQALEERLDYIWV